MRRANGSGQIFKVKDGNRRNRWRVRVTVGKEFDMEKGYCKQVMKNLGYFPTRAEAEKALIEYYENPYDIDDKGITVKELFEKWFAVYEPTLKGENSARTVTYAFSYMHTIENMKVRDVRVRHIEGCINDAYIISERGKDKGKRKNASANTKARMKSVFNLMFDFAVKYEVISSNPARNFNISQDILDKKERDRHKAVLFTNDEIDTLWNNVDKVEFVDMILIELYSGWRPQELATLKISNINLEQGFMRGGMKTKAGTDRIVPIHPLIHSLIEKRYNEAVELNSDSLFNDCNSQTGMRMSYDKYSKRFDKVMKRFGMEHRPHETRHSFVTNGKRNKIDEYILKRIVGHAIEDITENVYTQRDVSELKREMLKITKHIPELGEDDKIYNGFED